MKTWKQEIDERKTADQDLTKQFDVVELMRSSASEVEWNYNCDRVKAANNGGYPGFWYAAIILSGVFNVTGEGWQK